MSTSCQPDDVAGAEGVYALLTDGTTVLIRRAAAGDEATVRQMHERMSPANAYLRFFSISPLTAGREARRITRPPGPDHCALLAWLGDELVGVASFEVTDQPDVAEIAFAVSDDMHGRGVATLLLDHLVSIARLRGLRTFTAETLAGNTAMLGVFAAVGLAAKRELDSGIVRTTFPLPADEADQRLSAYLDTVADRERRADVASLGHLLRPASVAVIGASRDPARVGNAILRNILAAGFAGQVHAVNPRAASVLGVPSVPSVTDLPEPPDLAVIAVPAAHVPGVAEECGRHGVRSLVVITSGIDTEAGPALLAVCRRHGMRLVGPNCFGIAIPDLGLNATFAATSPPAGLAGLVVQSGGIGVAMLEHLSRLGIGISSFASVGDKYDVSSNDMLQWWEQDGVTRLALLYVESFGSPRKFAQTARRVGRQIPVLTVIGGRSVAGQRAAASHTSAAATPLVTQEALFGQAGVIATTSLGELIDATALLACQPLPAGNRIGIVTNAGGAGVLAADACGDNGLLVAVLSDATQERLREILPGGAAVAGPVDTTAAVSQEAFRSCIETVADDDGVDAVMAITVPTALGDLEPGITGANLASGNALAGGSGPSGSGVSPDDAVLPRTSTGKPLVAVRLDQHESVTLRSRPGGEPREQPATARQQSIPSYLYPESAARALRHAVGYGAWRSSPTGQVPELTEIRLDDARRVAASFMATSRLGGWLPPEQATELLSCYGIAMVPTRLVTRASEAAAAAAELMPYSHGAGVALKADVPGVVHKSDARAVLLGLHTEDEVRFGYAELSVRFGSDLRHILVQPMITDGVEVLIGVVHEPVFGPLVVFGLGGVATEVLGDHAARLTPLTDIDANAMILGIRAGRLLRGYRAAPPADLAALADLLLRVSRLADEIPEVAELDLNPVIARHDGAYPVDARIRLAPAEPSDPFLRRLR